MSDENEILIKLWCNDAKRKAFLQTYQEWESMAVTEELGLYFYKYELPSGITIIAMKHHVRRYAGYGESDNWETDVRFYVMKKGELFTPASHCHVGQIAELLKNEKISLQKQRTASAS